MSDQTLSQDFARVSTTNLEYSRNRDRWAFLLDSYIGGDQYKQGNYLTRYQLETQQEYNARIANTPLINHCSSVISVYTSFLFREEPDRDFATWEGRPDLEAFLSDCDMEGRDLDCFMKDVATWSSVFGHCWLLMTKPNIGATTQADEQAAGLRPWLNLLTPLSVLDWSWERTATGYYELTEFKYIEEIVDKITIVKEWTKSEIRTWVMDDQNKKATLKSLEVNGLGMIPAVLAYNKRSIVKGIGVSDIADIADLQRMIYNLTSELDQSHRQDGHPSLVVTPDTQFGSGAGAVIVVPENSDPGLRPYYLEHGGANIVSLHDTIQKLVENIDKIANTGGIRATESRTMSGVAMEVEFSLLNSRLAEKADNLELAEEQLWNIFAAYQGLVNEVDIDYPGSFNIRDDQREFQQLASARSASTNPKVWNIIDGKIVELLGEDPAVLFANDMLAGQEPLPAQPVFEPHIMVDPITGNEYIARTEQEHLDYAALGYVHKEEEEHYE